MLGAWEGKGNLNMGEKTVNNKCTSDNFCVMVMFIVSMMNSFTSLIVKRRVMTMESASCIEDGVMAR